MFARILHLAALILAALGAFTALRAGSAGRKTAARFALAALVFSTGFFLIRAYLKSYFPFTDKIESFASLFWLMIFCALLLRRELSSREFAASLLIGFFSGAALLLFADRVRYPSPYLRTVWFPLHVPLSFAAYALWIIAAVRSFRLIFASNGTDSTGVASAGVASADTAGVDSTGADSTGVASASVASADTAGVDSAGAPGRENLATRLNRNAFILFTLSMIFGGIWGYLAWGAYFMWDPKLLWSVILWVFYSNLLHIDHLPSFRRWREPLYLFGVIIIFITFIGTGFFSRSIHRF